MCSYNSSDEDINVKVLVTAWLSKENESTVRFLNQLIDDYFYKGIVFYVYFLLCLFYNVNIKGKPGKVK